MPHDPAFSDAFVSIVREHYERLATFAYRITGERDAAEDAVQEVLLRVWERRDATAVTDLRAYLYRAVYHQALGRLRRDRRWRASPGDDALEQLRVAPDVGGTEDLADAMAAAVQGLPERMRLIYSMSREQQLTYAQIAQALGISVKTVETQMGRALRTLRARLAPWLCLVMATFAEFR